MKKVLFMLSSMNIGGVEKSLLSLLSTLSPKKYHVTILLLDRKGGFLEFLPNWVEIREATWFREIKPVIMGSPYETIKNYLKNFQFLKCIRFLIGYYMDQKKGNRFKYYKQLLKSIPNDDEVYDVAIAYAAPTEIIDAYIACKVRANKKISWIHFDVSHFPINEQLYQNLWDKYDELYVVSEESKNQLINKFPMFKEKCTVRYNIISKTLIQQMANEEIGISFDQDYFNIVTVGRLSKEKGQDLAIEALYYLKQEGYPMRWYCIGDGNAKWQYMELVKKYHLERDFIFIAATPNPYPYMKKADLYVQPSRHDGYCLTLAEALCLDKVVISTKFAGAIEQIVDGKNGYLVNITVSDLVNKIKDILAYNPKEKESKMDESKD